MKRLLVLFLSLACLVIQAADNLFPADGIEQFTHWKRWQFETLSAQGKVPEGLRASSEKTLQPIWAVETSAPLAFGVKKGDLLALTALVRGVAEQGPAELRAKIQDKTYEGVFNENLVGEKTWARRRVFGIAKRDYPAGTMRLHLYPGLKRQAIEVRDWRIENFGPIDPAKLPALAAVPSGMPTADVKIPDGPPSPPAIDLPPLTASAKAKKRYIIIKLDDFGSGPAGEALYPKGLQVTELLKKRKIPASLGICGYSLEWGNPKYVDWLKVNARANGGNFDYWQHGWTHKMNIEWKGKCYIAEYAIPDYSYQKENFDKAQRVFKEKTGLALDGFCAPCGAITEETRRLLREHTEIKTWLYGDVERPEGKFAFRRTCNLECRVGVVEVAPFVNQYKSQRTRDYIMLQGHPFMWNEESFAAFERILDRLVEDGWTFTTHTEYHKIVE